MACPALPLNVGRETVTIAFAAGAAMLTVGGVASTVNVTAGLLPVCVITFVCSASAVYCPDFNGEPGVIDHVPSEGRGSSFVGTGIEVEV